MSSQSAALLRDEHITEVFPPSASSICFQSAGQVVTVLRKLDRHFEGDMAVAAFAKQAVAEYAAKREAQIVSVIVLEHDEADEDADNESTKTVIHGKAYAVTVADLRDGRTQMDHINRVIERLRYLQAVMVMLSTTDRTGSTMSVGKEMGTLQARVQQVKQVGLSLEQVSKRVAEARQGGETLSSDTFKPILAELNRLKHDPNPEMRKIVQTMLREVKELQQLPIVRHAAAMVPMATQQVKLATNNQAPVKNEARFKVPLRLVAQKDVTEARQGQGVVASTNTTMRATAPAATRPASVLHTSRGEQLHTRLSQTPLTQQPIRQTGQPAQAVTRQAAAENRFRVIPGGLDRLADNRTLHTSQSAHLRTPQSTGNGQQTATRFSVITNPQAKSPVLDALVRKVEGLLPAIQQKADPTAARGVSIETAKPAAFRSDTAVTAEPTKIQPQRSETQRIEVPRNEQPVRGDAATVQSSTVQSSTTPAETRHVETQRTDTVRATAPQAQTIIAEATSEPLGQSATQNLSSPLPQQPRQDNIGQPKAQVEPAKIEPIKGDAARFDATVIPVNKTGASSVQVEPVTKADFTPPPANAMREVPSNRVGDNSQPRGTGLQADGVSTNAKLSDIGSRSSQETKAFVSPQTPRRDIGLPEGKQQHEPQGKQSGVRPIVQQFRDCGCGHCAEKASATINGGQADAKRGVVLVAGGSQSLSVGASVSNSVSAKPIVIEARQACEGICLCHTKGEQNGTANAVRKPNEPAKKHAFGNRAHAKTANV